MTAGKAKAGAAHGRRIIIKSDQEIAHMRRAGQIVALTLHRLAQAALPGTTTKDLDRLAEAVIRSFGATPTFYGLYGYPANICVSVNDEVVHGIPGDRRLQPGDIVSLDVGATVEGLIADAAITVGVGPISSEAKRLLAVTREALHQGISQARPGNRIAHISQAIQRHVEAHGCSVVRKLVGHGVGRAMHEPPQVPNFLAGPIARSPELAPGMTLAIEPMVNQGAYDVVQDDDPSLPAGWQGWTYRTTDHSLSAHFEHTIALTGEGCEILTKREPPAPAAKSRQEQTARGLPLGAQTGG